MQRTPKDYGPAERARIMEAVQRGLEQGRRVGVTARECGITEACYYRWVRETARAGRKASPSDSDRDTGVAGGGRNMALRRRGPLPAGLREQLQSRAVVLRNEDGLAAEAIAERLGVSPQTIGRWLADHAREVGFVQVSVVADDATEPAAATPVLVAPGGYRVEGLDVAGLAELLRRLA